MATELENLQKLLENKINKLGFFRQELNKAYDTAQKFSLTQDISKLESEVLELKKQIKEISGLDVYEEGSQLEVQIQKLNIDVDVAEIHLVNCNRDNAYNKFWDSYDNKVDKGQRFQFYFIIACPTQQPNSFAERMVYEVIVDELEEDLGAINYVSFPDSNRVKIEDLPLRRNARNSIREFKKYFLKRFNLQDQEVTLEEYIETGLPNLDYEYVATVFDMNASKWNETLMEEYLQWIIDIFSDTHPDVPNFLFFFALFLRDIHIDPIKSEHELILKQIEALQQKFPNKVTTIKKLKPIPVPILEDWIRDLGEQNQAVIEDTVKEIVARLPSEKREQYQNEKSIDMTDVERFQEMIYKLTQN